MSFSTDVKNEVARLEGEEKSCEQAELFGLLRISGSISLSGRKVGIHFTTENAALARRTLRLLKNNFSVQTEVIVTRSRRLKKNNRYQIHVLPSDEARAALSHLRLLSPPEEAEKVLLKKEDCKKAFLRGVFLAGGSVNKPIADYHLELLSDNLDLCQFIQNHERFRSSRQGGGPEKQLHCVPEGRKFHCQFPVPDRGPQRLPGI